MTQHKFSVKARDKAVLQNLLFFINSNLDDTLSISVRCFKSDMSKTLFLQSEVSNCGQIPVGQITTRRVRHVCHSVADVLVLL